MNHAFQYPPNNGCVATFVRTLSVVWQRQLQRKHCVRLTLIITLFAVCGCGARQSTYPPSGGFVKNSDGRGTALVWGISFDVQGVVGASSESHFSGSLHTDPQKTDARNSFTMGDVTVRLEKVPGSPITMTVDDKDTARSKWAMKCRSTSNGR